MKLVLRRNDLLPHRRKTNCSAINFECFTPEVQAAIRLVGKATFWEYDDSNYKVVKPPAETEPESA